MKSHAHQYKIFCVALFPSANLITLALLHHDVPYPLQTATQHSDQQLYLGVASQQWDAESSSSTSTDCLRSSGAASPTGQPRLSDDAAQGIQAFPSCSQETYQARSGSTSGRSSSTKMTTPSKVILRKLNQIMTWICAQKLSGHQTPEPIQVTVSRLL
ncbi:hypothetical protein B0H21DRAFT_762929, partial [Amylocystis lapponica]